MVAGVAFGLGVTGPLLFDSKVALLKNPEFWLNPEHFNEWRLAIMSSASGPSGRPVTMLSFAFNTLWSGAAFTVSVKAVNLLIHLLTGCLLLALFNLLLREVPALSHLRYPRPLVLTAVVIWLLHPLQVSTVLYAVQRMEQLSALFTVLGLLLWCRYRLVWMRRAPEPGELSAAALAVTVCTALAYFSKEDGVLLLPLIVALEWALFRGLLGGRESVVLQRLAAVALALALLGVILLALFPNEWLLVRYGNHDFTVLERLLTQARVLWSYTGWYLLPDIRQMALHHDDIAVSTGLLQPLTTALAVIGWCAVIGLAAKLRGRAPLLALTVSWFLVLHVMESTVLPLEIAYEHRNYLASMGLALAVSALLWQSWVTMDSRLRTVIATVLVLMLAAQTGQRSHLWADEQRLAAYQLRHHPQSLRSVYHYANTQLRLAQAATEPQLRGEFLVQAERYYRYMYELSPQDLSALVTLLYMESRYGDEAQARSWVPLIQGAVQKRFISTPDRNALDLLLQCMRYSWCAMQPLEFEALLEAMAERFPLDPHFRQMHAYYVGDILSLPERAIVMTRSILADHPGYWVSQRALVAWQVRAGYFGDAMLSLQQMLPARTSAADVLRVKAMLESEQ